ncbi:hypothetical protein QAD02_016058 [Eretmocerus hayati]|uniref:Uncharacterized protein n=1 Tax=Eretmocerus hayati TaxID=131215 RepID=A0ACC2P9Y0_9HYME|nr:hypothetical protein QAD02_016058 [Eretmocerus hayati]
MPIWITAYRYFRHHLIFGLIVVILFVYFIFNLFYYEKKGLILGNDFEDINDMIIKDSNGDVSNDEYGEEEMIKLADKPLLWQLEVLNDVGNGDSTEFENEYPEKNVTSASFCRNSVQGKSLIVDEKGYVCTRFEVLPNGCCDIKTSKHIKSAPKIQRSRYPCDTCNPEGCCLVYEYCVSCCVDPNKVQKKKNQDIHEIIKDNSKLRNVDILKLRLRNLDHFQTCLAACRTSSSSVVHENTYKNPDLKYCYMIQLPHNRKEKYERESISLNNDRDHLGVSVKSFHANFFEIVPQTNNPPLLSAST